jgi:hypothetical protein
MKVKILKSGKFSFSPSERMVDLKEGDILDLPYDRSMLLIETKWAINAEELREKAAESNVVNEEKMQDTSSEENKSMDLAKLPNKLFKRGRGRPPKVK